MVLVARRDLSIAAPERILSEQNQSSNGTAKAVPNAYTDFTPDLLASFPLTEVSAALHRELESIIDVWTDEVRPTVAAASRLPFDQLADNVPAILKALADALGSENPAVRHELLVRSPVQGITRFQQHYDPRDLMVEDRLLRRLVVRRVERALARRMTLDEYLSINMGLDLMSQQAVTAYIEHQNAQLRSAAEAELRYLSFLSHDLSNNLSSVTLWLQVLKTQLQPMPELEEQVNTLDTIQQQILTTVGGMGRLLQAERMRHGGARALSKPVKLRPLVTNQTRQVADLAARRGIKVAVDVPKDAEVTSDPDLITLVMQNLIGNAAKFAITGTVRIRAEPIDAGRGRQQWALSVSDEGPGIPPEHVDRIFQAFQRGTMEGATGVGLGLAIASRAAALLGGSLSVESKLGVGSTFTLTLPMI